jgi:hypothetical protein
LRLLLVIKEEKKEKEKEKEKERKKERTNNFTLKSTP